jgi:hypothetical protein
VCYPTTGKASHFAGPFFCDRPVGLSGCTLHVLTVVRRLAARRTVCIKPSMRSPSFSCRSLMSGPTLPQDVYQPARTRCGRCAAVEPDPASRFGDHDYGGAVTASETSAYRAAEHPDPCRCGSTRGSSRLAQVSLGRMLDFSTTPSATAIGDNVSPITRATHLSQGWRCFRDDLWTCFDADSAAAFSAAARSRHWYTPRRSGKPHGASDATWQLLALFGRSHMSAVMAAFGGKTDLRGRARKPTRMIRFGHQAALLSLGNRSLAGIGSRAHGLPRR